MKTSNIGLVTGFVGFLTGVVAGVVGVGLFGAGERVAVETEPVADETRRVLQIEPAAEEAGETPGTEKPVSVANGDVAASTQPESGTGQVWEAMMEMGAEQGRARSRAQVALLAERLGLDEAQAASVEEAFQNRLQRQQAAGMNMMQGKATVAEMAASDEDYFVDFDAAVEALLTGDQLGEFAAYKEEREGKRIAKKADEEVGGVAQVADLTEEQRAAAWEIFAEIQAEEGPEKVPEGTTVAEFEGFLDTSLANRMERLKPVLDAGQLGAYKGQLDNFREMLVKLVAAGTGNPKEQ